MSCPVPQRTPGWPGCRDLTPWTDKARLVTHRISVGDYRGPKVSCFPPPFPPLLHPCSSEILCSGSVLYLVLVLTLPRRATVCAGAGEKAKAGPRKEGETRGHPMSPPIDTRPERAPARLGQRRFAGLGGALTSGSPPQERSQVVSKRPAPPRVWPLGLSPPALVNTFLMSTTVTLVREEIVCYKTLQTSPSQMSQVVQEFYAVPVVSPNFF